MADKSIQVWDNNTKVNIDIPVFDNGDGTFSMFPLSRASDVVEVRKLTFSAVPDPGDTLTVGSTTYTFVAAAPGALDILIAASITLTIDAIIAKIGLLTDWTLANAAPVLNITAKVAGSSAARTAFVVSVVSVRMVVTTNPAGTTVRSAWAIKTV